MIHIYTGDGKGKTSAAIGLALRFCHTGKKVLIAQFLKDGTSGEICMLKQMDNIEVMVCEEKLKFTFQMNEEELEQAKRITEAYFCKIKEKVEKERIPFVVLDEIMAAISAGLLKEPEVLDFLKKIPEGSEVVLTGRNPSREMLNIADYVTEMRKIRHPYDKGVFAREGIEY
ncbi:MAG: cob(I)yrinic acid a,c-diamide adenosyltransferase [Eubacterium sp.]|jgi:ATP:corrinoid adenosyltransferase|nr:cob(I)yrinic acid a,c-diamide adenosyltransferase [Eubacterium sp.]